MVGVDIGEAAALPSTGREKPSFTAGITPVESFEASVALEFTIGQQQVELPVVADFDSPTIPPRD